MDTNSPDQREKRTYHHGDLRSALLRAAEEVLAEKGVEGFTLRGVARAAGVSHSAPAHHFKTVTDILTAMTLIAFERLRDALREAKARADAGSAAEELRAASRGYFDFARNNPQHFRLMFRCHVVDQDNEQLRDVAREAFFELVDSVSKLHGIPNALEDTLASNDVMLLWSLVHGYAYLYLEQQLPGPVDLQTPDQHGARLEALFDRILPAILTTSSQVGS